MPSAPFYSTAFWRQLRRQCLELAAYRCWVPGCTMRAVIADHIIARPPDAPGPTAQDVLSNLRAACTSHDCQVREQRRGDPTSRRQGGKPRVRGCDASGWPLDPARR